MQNISGFGLKLNIIASKTFPTGITLTQFADDTDPVDIPSIPVADAAMGLNGDLLVWNKANPLKVTVAVCPNGPDDSLLEILLNANRVGRGKTSAQDIITMTATYSNGEVFQFTKGTILEGTPASSVSSAGRKKSKVYAFAFENGTTFNPPVGG